MHTYKATHFSKNYSIHCCSLCIPPDCELQHLLTSREQGNCCNYETSSEEIRQDQRLPIKHPELMFLFVKVCTIAAILIKGTARSVKPIHIS